jgi:hypothetical protein
MNNIIKTGLLIITAGFFIMGCKKEISWKADSNTLSPGQARLKINAVTQYRANPTFHLKVNGARVSNQITARTPFPGGGYNTGGGSANDYLAVASGRVNISAAIPYAGTSVDSVLLFSRDINIDQNKYYTAHVADTGLSTRVLVLEDDQTTPETGFVKYRFVNLMPNAPAVDLYFGTTRVATNIAYMSASDYFLLPNTPTAAWTIRETGTAATSTAMATYAANTAVQQNMRGYTVFASGYKGLPATDPRRPFVAFYLNK